MENIVDVIVEAGRIITEIKKCVSLYHFCQNKKQIYDYILKDIFYLDAPEVLTDFNLNYFTENSSLEVLKLELLKLYKSLTREFVRLMETHKEENILIC